MSGLDCTPIAFSCVRIHRLDRHSGEGSTLDATARSLLGRRHPPRSYILRRGTIEREQIAPGSDVMRQIHLAADVESLAADTAAFIAERIATVLENADRFSLVLSGGNTPRKTYQQLAARAGEVDWSRVHLYWGDERCVPHTHPDSNYRMANEMLISKIPLPGSNIHPMECNPTPEDGAHSYEQSLHREFPGAAFPHFDLILLGLGGDGHTASLFPGTDALQERERWVVANRVEKLNTWRLTLTLPVLNAAAAVVFLVAGSGKADILKEILEGTQKRYPAQLVQPDEGTVHWFLDQAARTSLGHSEAVGRGNSA